MKDAEIFLTQDGSHSIFSKKFGESYHSKYGAIQESQHVFIDAALNYKADTQKELSILEIGFGTGLNAFMSFLEAKKRQLQIHYTAIEAYPISLEKAISLNYPHASKAMEMESIFFEMHNCNWNVKNAISDFFILEKIKMRFEELNYPASFDIIYFDAFAPDAQPELWETELLQKMYDALLPNGVLVTYCAKGQVKRNLKKVGFKIEALAGPPGKREMTRAMK